MRNYDINDTNLYIKYRDMYLSNGHAFAHDFQDLIADWTARDMSQPEIIIELTLVLMQAMMHIDKVEDGFREQMHDLVAAEINRQLEKYNDDTDQ